MPKPDADVVLPVPVKQAPARDDHAWSFRDVGGTRTHVRLRVWPTKDGGHLVVATELQMGAGLINAAEALVRGVVAEFGDQVAVVRHFPAWTMTAFETDDFDLLVLDEHGIAHDHQVTRQLLDLLGAQLLGFPGDNLPKPVDTATDVPPQSVHLARMVAAGLRLDQDRVTQRRPNGYPIAHGPVAAADVDAVTALRLALSAIQHLAHFVDGIDLGAHGTRASARRHKTKDRVFEALVDQVSELDEVCRELDDEQRTQA
ncbi:hypothetical protein [Streptodolium elevatio]|uniref:Uncharacterized protein n=1 Tax=Streptodolium elevatio TaxID=3157996 RepID=A0ABV3DR74_9ACTN